MNELYIGLMSGTSMDAINGVLVDFSQSATRIIGTYKKTLSNSLRNTLLTLCQPGFNEIQQMSEQDNQLGHLFADTALQLLKKYQYNAKQISAIGSHGQTIRHFPNLPSPFSLQIGNPNIIAEKTGITTVADFRRRDIACGGQGAPLVVAFHEFMFKSTHKNRVILNLGGIANVTRLIAEKSTKKNEKAVLGFDTGPSNTLLDSWIQTHLKKNYDAKGAWAKAGICQTNLLDALLNDPYFQRSPPKSTGREYFNLDWLNRYLKKFKRFKPEDVQATLLALTTQSISQAIHKFCGEVDELIVCGGGINNLLLMQQLIAQGKQQDFKVVSSASLGVHPDWVEATAFAWLARQTLNQLPGNSIQATGARRKAILGGIYYG